MWKKISEDEKTILWLFAAIIFMLWLMALIGFISWAMSNGIGTF